MMVVVGDTVCFDPFEEITGFGSNDNKGNIVAGTVVFVNYDHKWFSVEYGNKQRTSFKFCDIGKAVKIRG
jgi:hypothetical protein